MTRQVVANTIDHRHAAREHELHRTRSRHEERRHGLDGTLHVGEQRGLRRFRGRAAIQSTLPGSSPAYVPAPPSNSMAFVIVPARNATSPSSAGRPHAHWARRSAQPIDDLALLDRDGRGERAAQLEVNERDVGDIAASAHREVVHGERRRADLVRRSHVHAVHLTVLRYRGEMYDAGREHDGQIGRRECACE